jgi:hypothetical protein
LNLIEQTRNELNYDLFNVLVVAAYLCFIVLRAQEEWNRERACEDIPRGVEDQSADVFTSTNNLSDPPQRPVTTVISEPVQVLN